VRKVEQAQRKAVTKK